MKNTALTLIVLCAFAGAAGCPANKSKSASKKMCAATDDPTTGRYAVVFKGFSEDLLQGVRSELHGKYFVLANKGGISNSAMIPGAHGFVVGDKAAGGCVLEVTSSSRNAPDKSINIQMFVHENGKRRRVYNPGTFNVTKMLAATPNSSRWKVTSLKPA